jgi:radical SAM protein with 4Fe4S-binding SPASM domain
MINIRLIDDPSQHHVRIDAPTSVQPDCDCASSAIQSEVPILDFPTIYSLELTPSCNSRCPGCSNVFFEDKETRKMEIPRLPLPPEQWKIILDVISPHATRLKVTGGEPTLHPNFPAILADIDRRNIAYTLFTNARWTSPKSIVSFLRQQQNLVGLLISLHGDTASAHDTYMGIPGAFAQTVPNIRAATNAGLAIHVSCIITQQNATSLENVIKLAQSLGAQGIVFNRYIGPPVPGITLSPLELARAVRQVDELRKLGAPVRFGTCIPLCFVDSSSSGCTAGSAYCTIDPWGNIRPCNHTPWITGNVLESLSGAWHSPAMQRWRSLTPNECKTCSQFSTCQGGCRADAVLNGVKTDPLMRGATSIIPLDAVTLPPTMNLYRNAIPYLTCELREQQFGMLLVQRDKVFPVIDGQNLWLNELNGGRSLHELEAEHGSQMLAFIGLLYQEGFLTLTV